MAATIAAWQLANICEMRMPTQNAYAYTERHREASSCQGRYSSVQGIILIFLPPSSRDGTLDAYILREELSL